MPTESSSCFFDFFVVGDLGSVVLDRIDVSPAWAVVGEVGAAEAEAVDFRGMAGDERY